MDADALQAPARGRYDRRTTAAERVRAQRDRLLRATALAFVLGKPTVSTISALARVGRASFYEFFDDFEHALAVVRSASTKALEHELNDALTRERAPRAALHSICAAFAATVQRSPEAALVALSTSTGEASPLGLCFARALEQWRNQNASAGRITPLGESPQLLLAIGAAEAFARHVARCERSQPHSMSGQSSLLAEALHRLLRADG